MRRIAALGANLFLIAFAMDASLTLADALTRLVFDSGLLAVVRNLGAIPALVLAPVVAVLLPFLPGLPLRAFLPALVFLAWALGGAMPLPLWPPERHSGLVLAALQATIALLAFVAIRWRSGTWWVRAPDLASKPFRPLRALAMVVAAALLVPAALATYGALSVAATLERATNGFMRFDLRGVVASEREYARGDRRVRLVGLMHVGEDDAYRDLVASFEGGDVILAEGVSDRDGRLREGLAYERMAQPLGLVVQPSIEEALSDLEDGDASPESGPQIVHADVDMDDLSDETIAFLRALSQVFASADLSTGLARARELVATLDAAAERRVVQDLVERRNAHLIDELDAALREHPSIIVPWGALHLPAIERALLDRGFEKTAEHSRRLVRYATVIGALGSLHARAPEAAPDRE